MPIAADIQVRRREAIIEILESGPVARQSDFVELLNDRGIEATQSSVSRDLRELGVAKLAGGYAQIDRSSDTTQIEREFIRGIDTAGPNLAVIKTATGAAARVALSLDRSGWPEIVGTISGDDTIFVATRSANEQKLLLRRLA